MLKCLLFSRKTTNYFNNNPDKIRIYLLWAPGRAIRSISHAGRLCVRRRCVGFLCSPKHWRRRNLSASARQRSHQPPAREDAAPIPGAAKQATRKMIE